MLSVALCTYNGEHYIREQLESILNQTMKVDEIIVCDDGSTDETLSILHVFANSHPTTVHIHRNDHRLGYFENFKKAISLCKGDLIFLADQDDIWHPDKVSSIHEYFLQHPEKQVVFTNGTLLDTRTNPTHKEGSHETLFDYFFFGFTRKMFLVGLDLESFSVGNHATGATLCGRGNFVKKSIETGHATYHDWLIALRAAEDGALGFIPKPLIDYRLHDGQALSIGTEKEWMHASDGRLCEWHPDPEAIENMTTTIGRERLAFMHFRNQMLHKASAPFSILNHWRSYRNLYRNKHLRIMIFDISNSLFYSFYRLKKRLGIAK